MVAFKDFKDFQPHPLPLKSKTLANAIPYFSPFVSPPCLHL